MGAVAQSENDSHRQNTKEKSGKHLKIAIEKTKTQQPPPSFIISCIIKTFAYLSGLGGHRVGVRCRVRAAHPLTQQLDVVHVSQFSLSSRLLPYFLPFLSTPFESRHITQPLGRASLSSSSILLPLQQASFSFPSSFLCSSSLPRSLPPSTPTSSQSPSPCY